MKFVIWLFERLIIYGPVKFFNYSARELYRIVWLNSVKNSFSQLGEDVIIDNLLGNKKRGFYVDVGTGDPARLNNTYRFYKRGWRGINIEPNPGLFESIVKKRPRDINLNIGVSDKGGQLPFFKFSPDTLSTFSRPRAIKNQESGFRLLGVEKVKTERLSSILRKHTKDRRIDFMSIDAEGYDFEVLRSNEWSKFRPKVICVEVAEKNIAGEIVEHKDKNRIPNYLAKKVGYKEVFNNGLNRIFVDAMKTRRGKKS